MKKFLEDNKIYFEIFSMSFLGLMAVIVSFTQWRTSNQEFELHQKESMPLFKISYELIKTDTTKKYDTEILMVSNEGKIIKTFKEDFFSFYIFNIKGDGKSKKDKVVYVPVSDFFGVSYNSSNLSGELFQAFSYGNNSKITETENYCRTLFSKNNIWVTPTRQVYFKFDFTDIGSEKHSSYFDTFGNEISSDEYNKVKEQVSSFQLGPMLMSDITHDFINRITNE